MDVVSVPPEIKIAVACVLIVGRILLVVMTRRDHATTRDHTPALASRDRVVAPSRATRVIQALVAVTQLTARALTIVAWLHGMGVL
jgi:hypothetical protein